MTTASERVLAAIDRARQTTTGRIVDTMTEQRFTGTVGEAGVGKSHLVGRAAAAAAADGWKVVNIDLADAYSANQLAWAWARQMARAAIDGVAFAHITSLSASLWPASTRAQFVDLPRLIGDEAAELMRMPYPGGSRGEADDQLTALARATAQFADRVGPTLVIVDHLEASETTRGRTPSAQQLLWTIRSVAQHAPRLHVAVVCRPPAQTLASGPDGAYLLDGRWLTIPPLAAGDLHGELAPDESAKVIGATGGHPAATHELVTEMTAGEPSAASLDRRGVALDTALGRVASRNVALARRFLENARAIHRLGGHLVEVIARGEGPYTGSPNIDSSQVTEAMKRLDLHGLVTKPDRRSTDWSIADPRVTWALGRAPAWIVPRPPRPPHDEPARPTQIVVDTDALSQLAGALSDADEAILQRLAAGATNYEIARDTGLSRATVARHLQRLYTAIDVDNRQDAIRRLKTLLG